jgi:hypothetical protein
MRHISVDDATRISWAYDTCMTQVRSKQVTVTRPPLLTTILYCAATITTSSQQVAQVTAGGQTNTVATSREYYFCRLHKKLLGQKGTSQILLYC